MKVFLHQMIPTRATKVSEKLINLQGFITQILAFVFVFFSCFDCGRCDWRMRIRSGSHRHRLRHSTRQERKQLRHAGCLITHALELTSLVPRFRLVRELISLHCVVLLNWYLIVFETVLLFFFTLSADRAAVTIII